MISEIFLTVSLIYTKVKDLFPSILLHQLNYQELENKIMEKLKNI